MRRQGAITSPPTRARDDRVLPTTRAPAAFIAPFLLVAFVLLYGLPGETARLWAWTITAQLTSKVPASAYLGGCYFFVRVLRARRWTLVQAGFAAVALFATAGALALVTGATLFLAPDWAATWWAWPMTSLTSRVVGATFCLGSAGLVVLRLMVQPRGLD